MAGQGPEPPLPAPYLSPWRRLGEDLRAVLADLGLALRRLLRLNRQGELPLPGFWPQPLAPLFWPLLIALGVALLALGGGWLWQRQPRDQAQPAAVPLEQAAERPDQAPPTSTASIEPPPIEPAPIEPAPITAAPMPPPALTPDAGPPAPVVVSGPEPDPAGVDPLRALLEDPQAAGLITGVRAEPGPGRLRFTLANGFGDLPLQRRQDQAERWLQWAHELGYDHLELWDGEHQLVAREALVGDGMILLNVRRPL